METAEIQPRVLCYSDHRTPPTFFPWKRVRIAQSVLGPGNRENIRFHKTLLTRDDHGNNIVFIVTNYSRTHYMVSHGDRIRQIILIGVGDVECQVLDADNIRVCLDNPACALAAFVPECGGEPVVRLFSRKGQLGVEAMELLSACAGSSACPRGGGCSTSNWPTTVTPPSTTTSYTTTTRLMTTPPPTTTNPSTKTSYLQLPLQLHQVHYTHSNGPLSVGDCWATGVPLQLQEVHCTHSNGPLSVGDCWAAGVPLQPHQLHYTPSNGPLKCGHR
jgi:hypothetical protein